MPTLAFARLPAGCVPLGRIKPPLEKTDIWADYAHLSRGPGERGVKRPDGTKIHTWRLVEQLPFDALDAVRGTQPHPGYAAAWRDLSWLDLVPHDRVAALRQFLATWYADVPSKPYGPGRSDLAVPDPLREFYRAVAGRRALLGRWDEVFTSDRISADGPDGWYVFGADSQGCFHWLMEPTVPDPAVGYDDDRPVEPEPLSGFLLQFSLSEAAAATPVTATAAADPALIRLLTDRLQLVPLQPAGWLAGGTFHVAPGIVAAVSRYDSESFVTVGARHGAFLRPLRSVDLPWTHFDG
ncbi:hypothetical protein I0C86_19505 [Plantactinospora sp. S1510]|uniref:SMI1/KNR4 family protein n=1 Tax=Plantactinospora alkalitolerans TaxID=2789879 RepID=A0ABS0GYG9_9ACTN|nr:hypothetical protein [Plantactinospora alkalitolerans]MBF9131129.1 hypothetical protein [Plantactinospora alkalitolerans]